MDPDPNDKSIKNDAFNEGDGEEALISIAQDERNDMIPEK